jgi:5-formyltetrahydrofolate cyclo-ligase
MMEKPELRRQLRQERQTGKTEMLANASAAICERLLNACNWAAVESLHCFEPIDALREVDIAPFLENIQATFPSIQLFTSRRIGENWRVVSTETGVVADDIRFDAVIVPMLGFDDRLHRLGYGSGYYDRLLAAQPQARKIGVCFAAGRIGQLPAEPHDIAMDLIVTENHIFPA